MTTDNPTMPDTKPHSCDQRRNVTDINAIIEEHYDFLFAFTKKHWENVETAQDITQEAMICLARSLEANNIRDTKKYAIRSWLCRASINIGTDSLRRRTLSLTSLSLYSEDNEEAALRDIIDPSSMKNIELAANQELINQIVYTSLKSMSPQFAIVFILSDGLDQKGEDIAATLNIPHNTVRSRLNRARTSFVDSLNQQGIQPDIHEMAIIKEALVANHDKWKTKFLSGTRPQELTYA